MNKEIKDKWVAALRSGKYIQGKGRLNHDGKFCCLGVLCEIDNLRKEEVDGLIRYTFTRESERFSLPGDYRDHIGLVSNEEKHLMNMNDNNTVQDDDSYRSSSFEEIADYIETTL